MFVYTVDIKGNQNGLVTFYKNLFCVQQKNSFGTTGWGRGFSMWQKCIIKFDAFVMNSVLAIISVLLCPVSPQTLFDVTIATP